MRCARYWLRAAAALACAIGVAASAQQTPDTTAPAAPSETLYRNAQVWLGDRFETRDVAVKDGYFVAAGTLGSNPATIDVTGRFIVPAYGNAHCHLTAATEEVNKLFMDAGVFYAWNPNTRVLDQAALAFLDRIDTYDVLTAQGGITEPGGHPDVLYREILHERVYPTFSDEDFVGNMYHFGRTRAEIVSALNTLVSQHADFVKVYLLHSEDYEQRKVDPRFHGRAGLDPLNLPFLVQEAAERGLFVAAHVETVADLRAAAIAGVKVAEHLPGYAVPAEGEDVRTITLTAEDAALLKRAGMLVVPTYALAATAPAGLEGTTLEAFEDRQQKTFAAQATNLQLLQAAGVPIISGTDTGPAIFEEVEHWTKIGGLSIRDTLAASLATGRHLFAGRRLGCFEVGCEADFLVLRSNPLADLRALRDIELKVKAGKSWT